MSSKISVIVPVYNAEEYLDRCVTSIINQTYRNLEIILIDDGSTDNCPVICDEWTKKDSRIIVMHKVNEGVSSARNTGLDLAMGEYIGFVDSDDWIDSNMYCNLSSSILRSNADIALCDYFKVSGNQLYTCDKPLAPGLYQNNEVFHIVNNMFGGGIYFASVCRGLYKKEVIDNFNLRFLKLKFAEDLMFCLDYLLKCKSVCLIDDNLYYYFDNNLSSVHTLLENDIPNFLSIPSCIYTILQKNKVENGTSYKNLGNEQMMAIWRTFHHTKNYKKFNRYLKSVKIFYGFNLNLFQHFIFKHKVTYCLLKVKLNKIIYFWFLKDYKRSEQ